MTISEIQEKILSDEAFVLKEIKRLQYLYKLKQIIRAKQVRTETIVTESVAEHIYSLGILARYFLPLEDPNHTLDHTLIHTLILWHEIDEIESGDIVPWEKSAAVKAQLHHDARVAFEAIPQLLRGEAITHFEMYEAKASPEARFVKAIDKLDPIIDSYSEAGKIRMANYVITAEQNLAIKLPYIADYPFIKRFCDVIHERFIAEGFFST